MGQIIGSAAKPKRCNLQSLSSVGVLAAGEYVLVSSDNSANEAGQGNFDCYVIGNGTLAAEELELHKVNKDDYVFTELDGNREEAHLSLASSDGVITKVKIVQKKLTDVIWENKTYLDIFETNNWLLYYNNVNSCGFDNNSFGPNAIFRGTPTLVNDVYDTPSYSMKCFSTGTEQNLRNLRGGVSGALFLAARIKCIRYTAGDIGVTVSGYRARSAALRCVTNGWVTKTKLYTASSEYIYIGSFNSANLDGYVDSPVVVKMSIFTNAPTLSQMTKWYNEYIALKKKNGTSVEIPTKDYVNDNFVTETDIDELQQQLSVSVKKVISDKVDISAFTDGSCQTGVANPDGTITSASSQRYTEVENLTEGQIFTLRGYYINSGGSRVYTNITINSVCAYSNGAVVSGKGVSYNAALQSYTIPSGIDKIRFTFSSQSIYANIEAVFTTENAITTFYPQQIQDGLPFSVKGSMEADTAIMLPVENVTCNKAWIFSAKIPSLIGTIKIGKCDNSGTIGTPRIEVDGTYVKTFSYTGSSFNKTFEHGLTIGNDIQVIVSQGWSHKVDKIIIQSGGNRWVSSDNNIDLGEETNRIGAVSTTALENAIISKSMFNIDCPIWVFGDSWVSYYPQRWVEQAVELGYGAWFLNGFAGEESERGLAALRSLIGRHIPRVLLWLYGMNDPDTNDSTVNVSWQSCYNEVVSICENNNIDLVLATIPTTPTRNNNAKNAIVTSSGHRYVDQVAAMGADTSGNWISGYQSQDGNHTTEAGAKALMARFFADVPELMWSK